MTALKLVFITIICLFVSACERYTWTVNERAVYNPPTLFKDYSVADPALADCIDQIITDQRLTRATQLTRLNCSHAGIKNVEGLTIFTGLAYLDLSGNSLSHIKPLLFLPYLDTVNLKGNAALSCSDVQLLAKQLTGKLQLPAHCN